MKFTMIVEPIPGIGYRATGASGLAIGLCADGTDEKEAKQNLFQKVNVRKTNGAKLDGEVEKPDLAPWKATAGWLKNDPMLDEWRQAMLEYRAQIDREDADRLALEEIEGAKAV